MLPPREHRLPREDWASMLARLQRAGLVRELDLERARGMLGTAAARPPDPVSVSALLHHHYVDGPSPVDGQWRRQADRFVEVVPSASPSEVATALAHAMPVLAPLSAHVSSQGLELRGATGAIEVPRFVTEGPLRSRLSPIPVEHPSHVVRAANLLLMRARARRRFVQLPSDARRLQYVALDMRRARLLHAGGLTVQTSLPALYEVAAFSDGSGLRDAI